jgi:RNA polymerase sigma-70 factor (ECF subfamily)
MGALFSWLRTTVSNSCIDFLRKENIREAKEADVITHYWQEHYNDTFEASDKEAVILERLLKQIDQLPPKFKQVFKMRWLLDLKFREISEQIGADISTVKKRYSRALTLLRK